MQLKEQKKKLKAAEKRAIQAERTVKKLLKEVDMKEGELACPGWRLPSPIQA